MNGAKTQVLADNPDRFSVIRKLLFQLGLIILVLFLFLLITLFKSKETSVLGAEPVLYVYAIFVATFQLSRLTAAAFYERSYRGTVLGGTERKKISIFSNEKNAPEPVFEPRVTFIVPCKNEEKVIAETVANCFQTKYPKDKMEVLVINDGSTDRTGEILNSIRDKYKNLTVINWKKNRGKKQAMAEGIRRSKGEIIIQLDSDSFIDPIDFRKMLEPFKNPKIGAVSVHTDPQNADKNFLTRMQAAYYFMSFRILKAAESTFLTVFCCSGCASAYRKDIILPVLDEWLGETFLGLPVTWGDDRALTSRVLKQGYRTVYTDKVKAQTIVPEKFRQLVKQQIRWKKSWFVNAIYNSRFIWKKQPFVAFVYYFPLIALTTLSPFMAARAVFVLPIFRGIFPFHHAAGVLLLMALFAAYYRVASPENKYWPYLFPWALFNLFFLSFLTFYAVLKINDRGWGTR